MWVNQVTSKLQTWIVIIAHCVVNNVDLFYRRPAIVIGACRARSNKSSDNTCHWNRFCLLCIFSKDSLTLKILTREIADVSKFIENKNTQKIVLDCCYLRTKEAMDLDQRKVTNYGQHGLIELNWWCVKLRSVLINYFKSDNKYASWIRILVQLQNTKYSDSIKQC